MGESTSLTRPDAGGALAGTQVGGSNAIEIAGETGATAALAAAAKAAIEARYIIALRRPRDWGRVRERLLAHCQRPSFADAATYNKPVGDGIRGLSIRFAEVAAAEAGNIVTETMVMHDDESIRIVKVSAFDYERNAGHEFPVVISKTVERKSPRKGDTVLSKRENSRGETTYKVVATEDELRNKQAAEVSKAMRTCLERLIPPDIKEECYEICQRTMEEAEKQNPRENCQKLADAFGRFGVSVEDLERYLGHNFWDSSAKERVELKGIGVAMKEEGLKWAEVMARKYGEPIDAEATAKGAKAGAANQALREKLDPKKAEKKAEPPPPSGDVEGPPSA